MSADFTIIIQVRQRFGDDESDPREFQIETEAPFVGASKEFTFGTPNVDRSQSAILQFQSLGVTHRKNILQINNVGVFGGLSTSTESMAVESFGKFQGSFSLPRWTTHSLLVRPSLLKNENNTLFIGARNADGGTNGNLDNFIIDNMIILYKYKTRASGTVIGN